MGWFGKQVEDAIRNIPHGHQRGAPRVRERHFRGASQPNCRRPCTGIQLPIHRRRHSRECTMAEPLRGFLSPVYPAVDDNVTHRRVRVHRSPVRFDQSLSAKAALRRIGLVFMGSFVWFPTRIDPASSSSMRSDSHLLQSTICRRGSGVSSSLVSVASSSFSPWLSLELPTYRRCPSTVSAGWHPRANAIDAVTRRLLALDVWPPVRPRRSHAAQPASIQDSCLRDFLLQSFSESAGR